MQTVYRRTLTGTWIEISHIYGQALPEQGRTLTGTWIEIVITTGETPLIKVVPSRVRGLKCAVSL